VEPGSLVMERKMLKGIKERAENARSAPGSGSAGSPQRAARVSRNPLPRCC